MGGRTRIAELEQDLHHMLTALSAQGVRATERRETVKLAQRAVKVLGNKPEQIVFDGGVPLRRVVDGGPCKTAESNVGPRREISFWIGTTHEHVGWWSCVAVDVGSGGAGGSERETDRCGPREATRGEVNGPACPGQRGRERPY